MADSDRRIEELIIKEIKREMARRKENKNARREMDRRKSEASRS